MLYVTSDDCNGHPQRISRAPSWGHCTPTSCTDTLEEATAVTSSAPTSARIRGIASISPSKDAGVVRGGRRCRGPQSNVGRIRPQQILQEVDALYPASPGEVVLTSDMQQKTSKSAYHFPSNTQTPASSSRLRIPASYRREEKTSKGGAAADPPCRQGDERILDGRGFKQDGMSQ